MMRLCLAYLAFLTVLVVSSHIAAESNSCNLASDGGRLFNRVPKGETRLVSRFVAEPPKSATPEERRAHLTKELVLAQMLASRAESIEKSCQFSAGADSTYELYFDWSAVGAGPVNACSLSRCAKLLADIFQNERLDVRLFSTTVESIVKAKEQLNIEKPTYLSLGLRRATLEVYRTIYAEGTPENMLVSLDKRDLQSVQFDEFVAWYEKLRSPEKLVTESSGPVMQRKCEPGSTSIVQQLDLAQSGWGHKAIILIDQGYSENGPEGIPNADVRELCTPGRTDKKPFGASPEPGLNCAREHLGADKWLVVYSNKQPVATVHEMKQLAEGIADSLRDEPRCESRPRLLLGTFSSRN
jgi:hypothetical protein